MKNNWLILCGLVILCIGLTISISWPTSKLESANVGQWTVTCYFQGQKIEIENLRNDSLIFDEAKVYIKGLFIFSRDVPCMAERKLR